MWLFSIVGGFNPSEKYQSTWKSSPNRGEHKKYLSCHQLVFVEKKKLLCHQGSSLTIVFSPTDVLEGFLSRWVHPHFCNHTKPVRNIEKKVGTLQGSNISYPTLGKGNSASKVPLVGDMLVPRRVHSFSHAMMKGGEWFQFYPFFPRTCYLQKRN